MNAKLDTDYISSCCKARVYLSDFAPDFIGDNPKKMKVGTCHFICSKCNKDCNFELPAKIEKPIKIGKYVLKHNVLKNRDGECDFDKKTITIDLDIVKTERKLEVITHELYHITKHEGKFRGLLGKYREEWEADRLAWYVLEAVKKEVFWNEDITLQ